MALLERVGTLLRANLNDLIDRAEDPEKMVKQVILDMENQLMQVKTQVAISIADLHLLGRSATKPDHEREDYVRKAAAGRGERRRTISRAPRSSVPSTRRSGRKLRRTGGRSEGSGRKPQRRAAANSNGKLADARAKSDILIAQHHRARAMGKAAEAHLNIDANSTSTAWDRMNYKVSRAAALSNARAELLGENVDDQFKALEKQDDIERLLADLKREKP